MRCPSLFFVLLLAGSPALAQVGMPLGVREQAQPPRNIVSSYCRMDYQGFRLGKDTWQRMKPLTVWKENPEWRGFTIISRYDISTGEPGLRAAAFQVQYAVLGRFDPGIGWVADPHSEPVSFQLRQVEGAWKIEEQDPPIDPHVSKIKAIAWLKSALDKEKDHANRLVLQKALKDLGGKQ
jgi:hypothetical protein